MKIMRTILKVVFALLVPAGGLLIYVFRFDADQRAYAAEQRLYLGLGAVAVMTGVVGLTLLWLLGTPLGRRAKIVAALAGLAGVAGVALATMPHWAPRNSPGYYIGGGLLGAGMLVLLLVGLQAEKKIKAAAAAAEP